MSRLRRKPKDSLSKKAIEKIREQILRKEKSNGSDSADITWAKKVLDGEDASPPGDAVRPEVIQALCSELLKQEAAESLARLATKDHKPVSKAARTALHRLRSKKIEVEVPAQNQSLPTGTGQAIQQAIPSVVSIYDGRWERLVWLGLDIPSGVQVYQTRISAIHGLMDFRTGITSRRDYRSRTRKILKDLGGTVVESDLAIWFINEGAKQSSKNKRELPVQFIRASQQLVANPSLEHPGLSVQPTGVDTHHLGELFDLPELRYWYPEMSAVRRLTLKLDEVSTSRLIVDDKQRLEQMNAAIDRGVKEYFNAKRAEASYRLLLDTAHIILTQGKEKRAAEVRAAADLFLLSKEQIAAHPFPRQFMARVVQDRLSSLSQVEENQEPNQDHHGLIIP